MNVVRQFVVIQGKMPHNEAPDLAPVNANRWALASSRKKFLINRVKMENYFFFVGLCFILAHEMDAIKCQEWTIFPLLSKLNEKTGYFVFTIIHVPLYLLLFWGLYGKSGLNQSVIMGLDIFFIVHIFLHVLFLKHPKNQFKSVFSWIIILGAGIAGLIDIIV